MGERSLSPKAMQELANLDKKELESCVKDLDLKDISVFLANVFEANENGSLSGEFTISLYEVVARIHVVKIVPLIDSIMESIVKTLGSSAAVSFPLQQACSKVVPTIASYGIDPTTTEEEKRKIIHSLCKPLSDSLSSSQESLNSGAALCLKALVDSDNWKFASDEMVNRVCQNVVVALEGKSSQTKSHMGLVMALARRNAFIVETYARLLILSGLMILNAGLVEGNSQKRLSAIQMVNFLMKCLDPRSIFSQINLIIEEMEKCQDDKMEYVKGAAFEALQTAKRIVRERICVKSTGSVTGSNSSKGESISGDGDHSPAACSSPESRTFDFSPGYKLVAESPLSANLDYLRRNVNVSLKDVLSSEVVQESATTSPQTPRKLIHSLQQYPNDGTLDCSEKQKGMFRSLSSDNIELSPTSKCDQSCFSDDVKYYSEVIGSLSADDVEFEDVSESVSSRHDLPGDADMQMPSKVLVPENRNVTQIEKALKKTTFKLVCGLSLVLVAIGFWISSQDEGHSLVPT